MDLSRGPLVLGASALTTEPKPTALDPLYCYNSPGICVHVWI